METSLPKQAQAVIIGGGVGGASIAYHLTQMGWKDIVVIERHELTSGSTFHSAGLVGQLRTSSSLTKMMRYSTDLYRKLKDVTGVDPGWDLINMTGRLNITATSGNKFTIKVSSLAGGSPNPAANFNSASSYSWTILKTTTGITGFDEASFNLDTSGFQNSLNGGFFAAAVLHGINENARSGKSGCPTIWNGVSVPRPKLITVPSKKQIPGYNNTES